MALRYDELTQRLADPSLYGRQDELKKVSQQRSNLEEIVVAYREYKKTAGDIEEAKKTLKEEKDEEVRALATEILEDGQKALLRWKGSSKFSSSLKTLWTRKMSSWRSGPGAGGDEASIFAADLLRLYQNYCKDIGLKTELISLSENDEGIKEVIFSISGKKVYSIFKYESGVHGFNGSPRLNPRPHPHFDGHRGRSARGLRYRLQAGHERGEGGCVQGLWGRGATCQHDGFCRSPDPSAHGDRGVQPRPEVPDQKQGEGHQDSLGQDLRQDVPGAEGPRGYGQRGQVGTGDRSERIRTYNYPQGRLTDHRIGLTIYNLESIMEGRFSEVSQALITHNQAELLKSEEEKR